MILLGDKIEVEIDEKSGTPTFIGAVCDGYRMNWISASAPFGSVGGFSLTRVGVSDGVVTLGMENAEGTMRLSVVRGIFDGAYREEYRFCNISTEEIELSEENVGIVFPYNCIFDKKENMHHKRCNSHIWCADEVCNIQSVKLSGQAPYLLQRAVCGDFSGYSLLCDVVNVTYGADDRGSIVLHPKKRTLAPDDECSFVFLYDFFENRQVLSPISASKYSLFVGESTEITAEADADINSISAECEGKEIHFEVNGRIAVARASFERTGEKKISIEINGRKTHIFLNVLPPLDEILRRRVEFITKKQQYEKSGDPLDGAYLIYDRKKDELYYNRGFADHNDARERLSMGTLVAHSLSRHYDADVAASLGKHREFIEREIVDVETGFVGNGAGSKTCRLYNFPWASTYYLEWYNFSGDKECLSLSAKILFKYYELGGANQESPCIEAYEILKRLESEGMTEEYDRLKREFLAHADSIYERKTKSSSHEVACANGMMNLMSTFLFWAYMITGDEKYTEHIPSLLKISESFYDTQPDYRMHGIALRYWDLYWFGKEHAYGDTYPQWLSALTAQMYRYCDAALGENHERLIRENLLGNCSVCFEDGFAACGYLYPQKIVVCSSNPEVRRETRPLGEWRGQRYDDFANDQDWSIYYAVKYLLTT